MSAPAPHRVGQPSPLIFHLGAALAAYAQALLAAPRAADPRVPWARRAGGGAPRRSGRISTGWRSPARSPRGSRDGQAASSSGRRIPTAARSPTRRRSGAAGLLAPARLRRRARGGRPGRPAGAGGSEPHQPRLHPRPRPRPSMLRWLAAQGLRPLLMDWGAPARRRRASTSRPTAPARLLPALAAIRAAAGRPVAVLGYCMGGTLAAGLAAQAPTGSARSSTIGAPWDFASTRGIAGSFRAMIRAEGPRHRAAARRPGRDLRAGAGVALPDALRARQPDPGGAEVPEAGAARTGRRGGARSSWRSRTGWPTACRCPRRAAKDLLVDWQIRNATAAGGWRFLGGTVDPRAIRIPALAFCGQGELDRAAAARRAARPRRPGRAHGARRAPATSAWWSGGWRGPQVWRPTADFLAAHAG